MQKCAFPLWSAQIGWTCTDLQHSDGRTPQEQVQQILNIAAILPGQTPERRFSIPERKTTGQGNTLSQQGGQSEIDPHQSKPSGPANGNEANLIDLQSTPVARPITTGIAQQGVPEIQRNPPGFAPPVQAPPKESTNTNSTTLSDDMRKLDFGGRAVGKEGPKSPGLRRMDSETNDIDEFVDAES